MIRDTLSTDSRKQDEKDAMTDNEPDTTRGMDRAAHTSRDPWPPGTEMVSIPRKRYESLMADSDTLARLEAAGVDNWEGYEHAFRDDEDDGAND
jgi:hypothetical protein